MFFLLFTNEVSMQSLLQFFVVASLNEPKFKSREKERGNNCTDREKNKIQGKRTRGQTENEIRRDDNETDNVKGFVNIKKTQCLERVHTKKSGLRDKRNKE